MSEYTPTTDEVRGDYAHFQTPGGTDPVTGEFAEGLAEFDRWLAKHDAEVECAAAEKAWDEGCRAGRNREHYTNMTEEHTAKVWPNPYREEA